MIEKKTNNGNNHVFVDKHIRSINKEAWDDVNTIRRKRGYSWKLFFDHLHKHNKDLIRLLSTELDTGVCTYKSMQTVATFLPKWCENIAGNMTDIQKHGDVSYLTCKTRKDNKCYKLNKLNTLLKDSVEHEMEDVAKECELPLDMMDYFIKHAYTYNFVPIAGSHICIGCKNRLYAGKPALIIGGGPSLEEHNHLELLKKYGFNGDIFVVGKELKNVLEHGIVPKYVGALDAEEFDTTFFNHDIVDKHTDNITALFGTTIHPTTKERWKGNRYYFTGYISEAEVANVSHVFHLMTKTSTLSVSGNIGSCMSNVATYLGYNPIVLIGMDLSFPTLENMKEYFPNATEEDWNRELTIGEKTVPMYKRGWNPDFKKQYYIDSVFESYKLSHLSWAKVLKHQGIKTINCSEQGSIHGKHIESMKFEDYLKSIENQT